MKKILYKLRKVFTLVLSVIFITSLLSLVPLKSFAADSEPYSLILISDSFEDDTMYAYGADTREERRDPIMAQLDNSITKRLDSLMDTLSGQDVQIVTSLTEEGGLEKAEASIAIIIALDGYTTTYKSRKDTEWEAIDPKDPKYSLLEAIANDLISLLGDTEIERIDEDKTIVIVVPIFNGQKLLTENRDFFTMLGAKNINVCFVDLGSTDKSHMYLERLARYPHIAYGLFNLQSVDMLPEVTMQGVFGLSEHFFDNSIVFVPLQDRNQGTVDKNLLIRLESALPSLVADGLSMAVPLIETVISPDYAKYRIADPANPSKVDMVYIADMERQRILDQFSVVLLQSALHILSYKETTNLFLNSILPGLVAGSVKSPEKVPGLEEGEIIPTFEQLKRVPIFDRVFPDALDGNLQFSICCFVINDNTVLDREDWENITEYTKYGALIIINLNSNAANQPLIWGVGTAATASWAPLKKLLSMPIESGHHFHNIILNKQDIATIMDLASWRASSYADVQDSSVAAQASDDQKTKKGAAYYIVIANQMLLSLESTGLFTPITVNSSTVPEGEDPATTAFLQNQRTFMRKHPNRPSVASGENLADLLDALRPGTSSGKQEEQKRPAAASGNQLVISPIKINF